MAFSSSFVQLCPPLRYNGIWIWTSHNTNALRLRTKFQKEKSEKDSFLGRFLCIIYLLRLWFCISVNYFHFLLYICFPLDMITNFFTHDCKSHEVHTLPISLRVTCQIYWLYLLIRFHFFLVWREKKKWMHANHACFVSCEIDYTPLRLSYRSFEANMVLYVIVCSHAFSTNYSFKSVYWSKGQLLSSLGLVNRISFFLYIAPLTSFFCH